MRKLACTAALFLAVLALSFKVANPSTWTLDKAHGKLGFSITHLLVSDVEGAFTNFDATIKAINDDFTDASVTMTADVATVNTANEKRDGHLKTADFFDAAKYPTITFASTSFKKVNATKYKVTGSLTMHGITKPVDLDVICKNGVNPMSKKSIAGFKITGLIKRADFNLGASYPGAILGDDITLSANAEFVKQ